MTETSSSIPRVGSCWQTGRAEREEHAPNNCARILPGSVDCSNQVDKDKCSFAHEPNECTGRTHAIGANVGRGLELFRLRRLEAYRSTERGLGHLSNTRAVHSSPVPLGEK